MRSPPLPHRLRVKVPHWRRWTLRARLVVVVAALSALALLVANAAGLALLRRNLTDRVDEQLRAMGGPAVRDRSYVAAAPPPDTRLFPRGRYDADRTVVLVDPGGGAVTLSLLADGVSPPALPPVDELSGRAGGEPFTVGAVDGSVSWRVLVVPRGDGGYAVPAMSLQAVDATADLLLAIDLAVMLLVLLLLAVVAAWVVRIGLRPLTVMERISTEITAGDLSGRVRDTDPHTEPGRLGIALNSMLDRIEAEVSARTASERRLRQFVADASHELRTPLTSIRGFAELYRRGGAKVGPPLDEAMGRIEAEAARMGLLVEDLLMLARLDLERRPQRRPVDLLAIAADTIRDAHARVPDRPVRLAALGPDDGAFEPVTVLGDEHGLRQVATNLVANALQHTSPPATVTVRVGRLPAGAPRPLPVAAVGDPLPPHRPLAVLEVADTGPGVPPEHADRVFERLYRADPSRNRASGGSGLGLSIVAAIVTSHGGQVQLLRADGAAFRVVLPG